YPPPTTRSRDGTAGRPRAVAESQIRSPPASRPGRGMGEEPVATTACLKWRGAGGASSRETRTVGPPADPPRPATTPSPRPRAPARLSSPGATRPIAAWVHALSRARSSLGGAYSMPAWRASAASWIRAARPRSALEGMQPTWRHSPPSGPRASTSTVSRPRSAARNAAAYPPGPPPRTTRSASRGSSPTTMAVRSPSGVEQEPLGVLEEADEVGREPGCLHPIDDPMIEGEREREDEARHDLAVADDGRRPSP